MSKKINVAIKTGNISEQTVEVEDHSTYENLLEVLKINPETVLVLNEGKAVPLDGEISSARLTILRVVRGG